MSRYAKGVFTPKNPQKYIGNKKIIYRSGWELTFMMFADNNDKILQWASESIHIPYKNPLTGKQTIYVPDFFIVYQNNKGQSIAELIEIKPKKQTFLEEKIKSAKDKAAFIVNQYKWAAANAWCKQNGISFRVITEDDLFFNGRK